MQNLKKNLGEKEKDKSGPLTTNSNLSYPKKANEIFIYYQKHKCPCNCHVYFYIQRILDRFTHSWPYVKTSLHRYKPTYFKNCLNPYQLSWQMTM